METVKLWTKDFIFITLSGLFSAMVFYVLLTTMAEYALNKYEINTGIAGLVASVFVLGAVFGRLLAGTYCDYFGRRKMAIWGNVCFLILCIPYLFQLNLFTFIGLRFIHGIAMGIINNLLVTIVVDFIPRKRLGEGIGFFSLNFVLATSLGPFLGMFVIQRFSYDALFCLCIGLAAAALLLLFTIRIQELDQVDVSDQSCECSKLDSIFEKKALPLGILIFIIGMCFTSVTAFLRSYTIELGVPQIAPFFFLVYGAFVLVIRPLGGKLLDNKGDNFVMMPSYICFAISLFLLGMADNTILFLPASIFLALGFGNILTVGQAIVTKAVPRERVSQATSTYFVLNDSGYGIGPLLLGMIANYKGFDTMFLIEGFIGLFVFGFYYLLHGRFAKK